MNFSFSKLADPDEPKRKEKRQKRCNTEDLATIPLSEALVKFLGTGETSLAPSDVIKRIWEYIDHNNLQVCKCCISLMYIRC